VSATERRTYHVTAIATPEAIDRAKAVARLEGWIVVTIARVALAPPGWDVTLIVRSKAAA
jgi:hypothetical protein